MNEIPERDRGLLGLVERLMKRPEPAKPVEPDEDVRAGLEPVIADLPPPVSLEPQVAVESTRKLSRLELADIILKALQTSKDCPQSGFEITVYGSRPWNALLRITPAAGRIDADAWRSRLQTTVMLFREQYELEDHDDEG